MLTLTLLRQTWIAQFIAQLLDIDGIHWIVFGKVHHSTEQLTEGHVVVGRIIPNEFGYAIPARVHKHGYFKGDMIVSPPHAPRVLALPEYMVRATHGPVC